MRPEGPAPRIAIGGVGIGEARKVFIDANDRGFPCTFTFEHVRTWQDAAEDEASLRSTMIANLVPTRGSPEEYLASQFVLTADGKAKSMGILLDDSLPDDEMIWFERVR